MRSSGTNTLRFEQTIGSGTFGKVKRAVHIPTNQKVAVKILNKHQIETKKDALRIKRQIAILKRVNHPNLLKLLQFIQTPKSYLLVTRLAQGEELYQMINRRGCLDEQSAGELFLQLLDAMLHLKTKGVVHRDIKPQNIIITNNKLTLIDFGLGCLCAEGQKLKTSCGSPCYAAPEMMSGKAYDPQKTEIWALGVTLYAMLSGNLPFQESDPNQLYKIMMTNRYEQPAQITSQLKELLRGMIESRPSKRLNLEEILQHRWVKAQQYEFFNQILLTKWDQRLLSKMQKELKCQRDELLYKIQNKFGEQSITYWLCAGQSIQNPEITSHNGPVHLKYIFKSVEAARQFIARQYPNSSKISQYKMQSNQLWLEIKKLGGCLFYVSCSDVV